jgi:hypothetical protein
VVAVPAGALVGAAATSGGEAAAPPTPRLSPAEVPVVTCPGCSCKLRTKPEWAGKSLKCPKCARTIKVPPADDWIDVTEPYVRPGAPAPRPAAAPEKRVSGPWGEEVLEGLGVPDAMREQIRGALTGNERLTWAGRPLLNVLMHRARRQRLVGVVVFLVVTAAMPALAWFLFTLGETGATIGGCVALFMMLVFQAIGVFQFGAPGRTRRNAANRPCYALTNRRLLIHRGIGSQASMSRGGTQVSVDATVGEGRVDPFTGFQLMGLRRDEDRAFPGTGELIFFSNLLDEPIGERLFAVEDVAGLEKRIREQLIHPVIDKLLRGEASVKEEFGRKKSKTAARDGGEVLPVDENLRDLGSETLPEEGNVKSFKAALDQSLKSAGKDLRQKAEKELAEGEKLLWVGKAEGSTQGRGLLGALAGSAKRKEPEYTFYAITNRRVLLWDKKGSAEGNRFSFANQQLGPITYYSPEILDAAVEEDKRFPDGGSIVFRRVKVVITRQDKRGKRSTETLIHHFGILRVRNCTAVSRVLFDTLIRPCRRV